MMTAMKTVDDGGLTFHASDGQNVCNLRVDRGDLARTIDDFFWIKKLLMEDDELKEKVRTLVRQEIEFALRDVEGLKERVDEYLTSPQARETIRTIVAEMVY